MGNPPGLAGVFTMIGGTAPMTPDELNGLPE